MRTDRRPSGSPRFLRLSPLAGALALAIAAPAAWGQACPPALTVVNSGDNGGVDPAPGACTGTLRQAIVDANANCATNAAPIISFNIPGTGPFTISPSTPLPTLSCGANAYSPTIDASTQPGSAANSAATGFNANLQVALDGSASTASCGLSGSMAFSYGGVLKVRGLEIHHFNYGGTGSGLCGDLEVYGNSVHDNGTGVNLSNASANIVGSAAAADRNVIGNNTAYGVFISYGGMANLTNNFIGTLDGATAAPNPVGIYLGGNGPSIVGNVVSGNSIGIETSLDVDMTINKNMIGTDATGTVALGNSVTGIQLSSPSNSMINQNVISGNGNGIVVSGGTVNIYSNMVGTDGSGTAAIGNASGIVVSAGDAYIVGNTVAGNTSGGIAVDGATVATNISGNILGVPGAPNNGALFVSCSTGVNISGNRIIGNTGNGLGLGSTSAATISSNTIESNTAAGAFVSFVDCIGTSDGNVFSGNTIDGNGADGVLLLAGIGNRITQSSIWGNGNKNIDLNLTSGPLPNDPGDIDSGPPNNQQNYPTISSVTQTGGDTTVAFDTDFVPGTYAIEFFENPAAGSPAGQFWRLTTTITVAGPASFTQVLTGLHDHISLTATSITGDTSEFSPIVSTIPVPAVTVVPPALDFGSVTAGATSPPQTATLSSSGTADYQIFSIDMVGSCPVPALAAPKATAVCASGAFMCSTTCSTSPSVYAPGTSCQITAQYAPIAAGTDTATIYVCDNAAGSPHTLTLTGSSVAATVTVSPASYNFGNVFIGQTGVVTFTITNSTAGPATLAAPTATAGFVVQSTTCGATLAPSATCSAQVAFSPTATGTVTGSFNVQSGTSVSAPLTGTGVTPPPGAVAVNPSSFGFGGVVVGQSALTTFTVSNPGTVAAPLNPPSTTGPFAVQSTTCGATLAPSGTCTADVAFLPTSIGAASGSLVVVSSNTVTVPLSGTGLAAPPVVAVNPSSYSFGDTLVGQTVSATFTVSNPGTVAVSIGAPSASGPFTIAASTCGATIAPSTGCTVDVAFTPPQPGTASGSFTIPSASSAATSVTVPLLGFGIQQPQIALPASIDLGTYTIGGATLIYTLELRNTGNAILTFSTVSTAAPFSLVNNCPLNLAETPCTVTLMFSAQTPGEYQGTLTIVTNAPGGSRDIALSARAQPVPLPVLRIDPTAAGFGERIIGTASAAQRVTITNLGGADAHFSFGGPGFEFVVGTNTCGASLAPQASCFADLAFRPLGTGPRAGALTVNGDDAASPHTVPLAGTGCRPFSEQSNRTDTQSACAP